MARAPLWAAIALSLALLPAPQLAAQGNCQQCNLPPGCRGNGNGNGKKPKPNCTPLTVSVESDINFGRLVVVGDGVGQVVLDLSSGAKAVSGGLQDLGGWAVRGRVQVTGAPNEPVFITFPSTISMTESGGASAQLRNFSTDISGASVLDANGQLEFNFTGTLYTDASVTSGGVLRGRIPISVSYP